MRGWRSKPSRRVWRHGHGGARVPREGQKRLGPHSWHGGSGKVPEHRVLDRHYCITTDITAITDITGITGVKRTLFCFYGRRRQGCGHGAPIMRGTLGSTLRSSEEQAPSDLPIHAQPSRYLHCPIGCSGSTCLVSREDNPLPAMLGLYRDEHILPLSHPTAFGCDWLPPLPETIRYLDTALLPADVAATEPHPISCHRAL